METATINARAYSPFNNVMNVHGDFRGTLSRKLYFWEMIFIDFIGAIAKKVFPSSDPVVIRVINLLRVLAIVAVTSGRVVSLNSKLHGKRKLIRIKSNVYKMVYRRQETIINYLGKGVFEIADSGEIVNVKDKIKLEKNDFLRYKGGQGDFSILPFGAFFTDAMRIESNKEDLPRDVLLVYALRQRNQVNLILLFPVCVWIYMFISGKEIDPTKLI